MTNLVDSVIAPPGIDRYQHQREAAEWRQFDQVTNVANQDTSPPGSSIGSVGDTFYNEAGGNDQDMDTTVLYHDGDVQDSISRNISAAAAADARAKKPSAATKKEETPPLYLDSMAVKRVKGYFPKTGGDETTIVRYERSDGETSRWQWQPLPTRLSISTWLDEQEGN